MRRVWAKRNPYMTTEECQNFNTRRSPLSLKSICAQQVGSIIHSNPHFFCPHLDSTSSSCAYHMLDFVPPSILTQVTDDTLTRICDGCGQPLYHSGVGIAEPVNEVSPDSSWESMGCQTTYVTVMWSCCGEACWKDVTRKIMRGNWCKQRRLDNNMPTDRRSTIRRLTL